DDRRRDVANLQARAAAVGERRGAARRCAQARAGVDMRFVAFPMHPLAELFPVMADDELEALAADIKANGQRDPIVLFDGKIVDGRHRYRACRRAGIEPKFTTFDGADADVLAFVASRNLHRRHLTESQRAMIAADLANMAHGGDRKSDQAAPVPVDAPAPVTQSQAATMMKVSERTVRDAVAVKKASPALAERVRAGTLPVKRAAEQVR